MRFQKQLKVLVNKLKKSLISTSHFPMIFNFILPYLFCIEVLESIKFFPQCLDVIRTLLLKSKIRFSKQSL